MDTMDEQSLLIAAINFAYHQGIIAKRLASPLYNILLWSSSW
jgi:hypothetical protein